MDFRIEKNCALATIDELASLTTIGGDLYIHSNPVATSLDFLASLTTIGGDLTIVDNRMLPTCAAQLLAQRLGKVDSSTISGNDDGARCP